MTARGIFLSPCSSKSSPPSNSRRRRKTFESVSVNLINPWPNRGFGCDGDPGRKSKRMIETEIVNRPSTISKCSVSHPSRSDAGIMLERLQFILRKNNHCHPRRPRCPSSCRIPEASRGLIALPPNIPKKKMATLFASSRLVYQVDKV